MLGYGTRRGSATSTPPATTRSSSEGARLMSNEAGPAMAPPQPEELPGCWHRFAHNDRCHAQAAQKGRQLLADQLAVEAEAGAGALGLRLGGRSGLRHRFLARLGRLRSRAFRLDLGLRGRLGLGLGFRLRSWAGFFRRLGGRLFKRFLGRPGGRRRSRADFAVVLLQGIEQTWTGSSDARSSFARSAKARSAFRLLSPQRPSGLPGLQPRAQFFLDGAHFLARQRRGTCRSGFGRGVLPRSGLLESRHDLPAISLRPSAWARQRRVECHWGRPPDRPRASSDRWPWLPFIGLGFGGKRLQRAARSASAGASASGSPGVK